MTAQWYAIQSATRMEKLAEASIRSLGYPVYLPCETYEAKHARRTEPKTRPLFVGYLFAKLAPAEVTRAARADGVHRIMGAREGGSPPMIREEKLAWIAALEHMGAFNRVPWSPSPRFTVGQKVKVTTNRLTGEIGEIVKLKGNDRVAVALAILGRSWKIEVKVANLRAA